MLTGAPEPSADRVVSGEDTRSGSVRAGLDAVPPEADVVLVHDGARPLATADLFGTVVAALARGVDAVVPAVPVTDTIRSRTTGVVDRADLVVMGAAAAPTSGELRAAHAGGDDGTDDASLVEAIGGTVLLVSGAPTNLKITYPTDLLLAEALLPGITYGEAAP